MQYWIVSVSPSTVNKIKSTSLPVTKTAVTTTIWVVALTVFCFAGGRADNPQKENGLAQKTIESVLNENTEKMMSIPGVVGTAQGLCGNEPCIKVFVTKKTPAIIKQVPKNIEGYIVDLEETGEIHAYPEK